MVFVADCTSMPCAAAAGQAAFMDSPLLNNPSRSLLSGGFMCIVQQAVTIVRLTVTEYYLTYSA